MQSLLWGVAVLACPVGMGVMMWMMMRGQGKGTGEGSERQVAQLRAEIDQLKADRVTQRAADRR
jgi:hypothetical protein